MKAPKLVIWRHTEGSALVRNLAFHCNEPECDFASATAGVLKRHQSKHTGALFRCCDEPGCDYASMQARKARSNLKAHQRKHIGELLRCMWWTRMWLYASGRASALVCETNRDALESSFVSSCQNWKTNRRRNKKKWKLKTVENSQQETRDQLVFEENSHKIPLSSQRQETNWREQPG